ncbi:MAG: shikimate kinase [Elusimicrobiota bacterium]|jgi:shikimate kinase|nr:shikimate kinase [Elusimicrobiota bacterium]
MNISLIGFMATGKSSVGKALAEKLDKKFIDIDKLIELKEQMPISEIFERKGEREFRKIESAVIEEVSALSGQNLVISCGGGAPLNAQNIENLRRDGIVICLSASLEVIYRRVQNNSSRPVFKTASPTRAQIAELLESRKKSYENCDVCIDVSKGRIGSIVRKILEFIDGQKIKED